jgi:hypothetical protein
VDHPYRAATDAAVVAPPRDAGIVGDIVGQFADRFAFFRELVQNAIDAGTPTVEVRLAHDAGAAVMRVSVRDDGEGMDRDIIENQLLVLFRSTKERDATKIGKFGIGFASVLAAEPAVVVVQTVRAGRRLTAHLYPDLSYELFDGGAATRAGTTVTLELALPQDEVEAFTAASRDALRRWCRHATRPITLVAGDVDLRIDEPLGLDDAVIAVRGTADDGALVAIVGVAPGGAPYGGFFNHGLMLHETTEPLVGRLAFKVQDSRLGHTLSRDNVRRDRAFDRALDLVRSLARSALPAAAGDALGAALDADDRARYLALAAGVTAAGVELPAAAWRFPLCEPLAGRRWVAATQLGRRVHGARWRSRLTEGLAAAGIPVVDLAVADLVRAACGVTPVDVDQELTMAAPATLTKADVAMVAELERLLDAAHRRPSRIVLAELFGCHASRLAIAGEPPMIGRDRALRSPFRLLRRPPLILGVGHPLVAAARARAAADPAGAASWLARAVLLHHELLDEARSELLLRRDVERSTR